MFNELLLESRIMKIAEIGGIREIGRAKNYKSSMGAS